MSLYFSIPDFNGNYVINEALFWLMREHPEMINPDVVVDSIYGCFPSCIWNGGRPSYGMPSAARAKEIIEYYNKKGIALRYTFTNTVLEEKHLYDTWGNLLLELGHNGKNSVIITSPILEEYIRKNYPKYDIVSSTTKCIRTIDEFNAECEKDYSYCVLHYDFNNKFDELAKVKYPERTELIQNESCQPNCLMREHHYNEVSRAHLNFVNCDFKCANPCTSHTQTLSRPQYISYNDIVEKYAPMGFNHYKVVGRAAKPAYVVEAYVQIFVKPEYHLEARQLLLGSVIR